ncbi:MAG: O-antigen ligase family protein, partial [Verrucomicrobiota bacterium]|nr:O-antigen ligase family protein [Verrucomicrobiota bacterium]
AASTAPWKDAATALLPVLACFLGGATEKWAEGIVVALLGLLLILNPPRASLGAAFNGIVIAVVAIAALAFLPARWFHIPSWREALVNDFGVQLPPSLSPQPWLTATCLASLIAGVAWLYYASAQELDSRSLRRQMRIFAAGVTALAALSIALYFAKAALPFWHNQRGFGPFPNRNQTADLLGISAVVIIACGQDDLRHAKKRWILWLAGLVLMFAALVLNFSRAGIAILVIGSALWVATLVLRSRSASAIALGLSGVLALLTLLLLFGGQTLERFHLHAAGDNSGGVTADFRWLIFRDTLALIRASPWCGIGLGNFQPVFAIFREASLGQSRALHPESDWLWVAAELGWPAVALIFVAGLLLARRVFPLSEGTNVRLRLGAFIAALLFAGHGLIDVSGHRVGSAYAGFFLLGLSLRRPAARARSASAGTGFRVVGLFLALIGCTWILSARGLIQVPGGISVDRERTLAVEANKQRNFAATIEHATRGLELAPLDWQLYFVRAIAKVGAMQASEEALADFRRARFLEPGSFEVPYQEGLTWITREPMLTMTAWREALRRAGSKRPVLYDRMLSAASQMNPTVNRMLRDFGSAQPDLALITLARANAQTFSETVERLLARDPALEMLTAEQKSRLFALWSERGDLERLQSLVDQHPDLLPFAWRGVANLYALQARFDEAVALAQRFIARPRLPDVVTNETAEQLQQKIFSSANNYEAGLALYTKQMQSGNTDDALITLRRFTGQPNSPAYFHFLEAEAWSAKRDWVRAWDAWRAYLHD